MATQRISWASSGSPYVTFYLDADVVETQPAPAGVGYGRWRIRVYLRMSKGSSSHYNGSGSQVALGNGGIKGTYAANPFLPSGPTSWKHGAYDFWVNANSNGYWTGSSTSYPLQMRLTYGNVNETRSGSITLSRLSTKPGAPPAPVFSSATARSITFKIAKPSSTGGLPILDYQMQVATSSSFGTIVKDWVGTSTNQVADNLNPSTSYSIRYRARNAAGQGPWSPVATMSTQAFNPPTISVSPTLSGSGATATVTPTGSTTPDKYDIEYEYLAPPPIPSPASKTGVTATGSLSVSGLTPGATYRWRGRSHSGSFVTGWSAWVTVVQPAPSTAAGDYFDGSSQPTDDQTFSWEGATSNSRSFANGVTPFGWTVFDASVTPIGGNLQRITGGFSGSHGALLTFENNGVLQAGIHPDYAASVEEGQTYFGSMYVSPPREGYVFLYFAYLDSSGEYIPAGLSAVASLALPGVWTRLATSLQAPPGAVKATVFAGFPGQGGDTFMMDAAMITMGGLYPYFDGSTPDTNQYAYAWTGTPNQSTSTRMPVDAGDDDPLVDPDCPPVPSAPLPPVIDSSCIEETGIWRRYWVSIPASEVATWKTMVPTVQLRTHQLAARQVRIRMYPNPFGYPPEDLDLTGWCSEQIVSFMPADTVLTLDGLMEQAWAEVQGQAALPANHLLYGTGGVPATWPELSCGIGYTVSLDVPLDAPESNLDIDVSLTARG